MLNFKVQGKGVRRLGGGRVDKGLVIGGLEGQLPSRAEEARSSTGRNPAALPETY